MSGRYGRVLLTGAAGRIARQLRPLLAPHCETLLLLDREPVGELAPNEQVIHADLADASTLAQVLGGVQAIVHFAGYPREAPWDTLMPANVIGVANLWEAAASAGVERIVYASSNHAVGFYPRDTQLDHQVVPRPDSRYGVTKVFMEALASMHADKHGLRAFGMRIGHCAERPSDARMLSHWIHPEDMAALVHVGLSADYLCETVYGVSDNARSWWDNSRAEQLGYRPKHSADARAEALQSVRESDPVAERYQGGSFAAIDYAGDPERPAAAR
ncbi:MAG: NAD(P)-dependent oxidoreductase [Rhizobacter sp.]|nr:NAD(P)-dependent oxidoreductase [Rhizobacter sp.]